MIELRKAEQTDVEWVFAQCEDFARFYGSKISLAGNPEYGKKFLADLIANHFVMIGLKDGARAGFIAGLVAPHHFNPDIIQMTELLWWVPEAYRNTGVGARLFQSFMDFGREHCNWIAFTLEEKSPVKDAFLLKRGFRVAEKAYVMECN